MIILDTKNPNVLTITITETGQQQLRVHGNRSSSGSKINLPGTDSEKTAERYFWLLIQKIISMYD